MTIPDRTAARVRTRRTAMIGSLQLTREVLERMLGPLQNGPLQQELERALVALENAIGILGADD